MHSLSHPSQPLTSREIEIPSQLDFTETFSSNEKEWFWNAIERIKNPQKGHLIPKGRDANAFIMHSSHHLEKERMPFLVRHLREYVDTHIKNKIVQNHLLQDVKTILQSIPLVDIDSWVSSLDEPFFLEILKKIALQSVPRVLEILFNSPTAQKIFNTPTGQKALIEITKRCLHCDPSTICENIHKIGIDISTAVGQQSMLEIAQLSMKKSVDETLEHIQKFGLDKLANSQEILIDLAKSGAIRDGWRIAMDIKNFGIDTSIPKGQQAMIEIAKLCFEQNGEDTPFYIQDFGIQDFPDSQPVLIELAKLAAQHNRTGISRYIDNYGIDAQSETGQQALIEIAMVAAQQNPQSLCYNIEKYGISVDSLQGQRGRIEIAKVAAQQYDTNLMEFIKKFQIDTSTEEGLKGMIAIAKLAAKNNGYEFSKKLHNFDLPVSTPEGQKLMLELALLAAQSKSMIFPEFIPNYGIKNTNAEVQNKLIEIAKIDVKKDGVSASIFIRNYGIDGSTPEGRQALVDIAKLAAIHTRYLSSAPYIANYGIDATSSEGKKALKEILMLALKNSAYYTSKYLSNYNIASWSESDRTQMLYFLYHCFAFQSYRSDFDSLVLNDLSVLRKNLAGYGSLPFSLDSKPFETVISTYKKKDMSVTIKQLMILCKDLFGIPESHLKWIQDIASKQVADTKKMQLLEAFCALAFLCSITPELRQLFKTQQSTLKKIFKLTWILRGQTTKCLLNLVFMDNFAGFESLKSIAKNTAHAELACLVLATYPSEGLSYYQAAIKSIQLNRKFKERHSQSLLLSTLLNIQTCTLSEAQKIAVIKKLSALPHADLLPGLQAVADLLALDCHEAMLSFTSLADLHRDLNTNFQSKFQVKIDNFYDKFSRTAGTWRQKKALLTYLAKLQSLSDREQSLALNFFQQLVTGILNGHFLRDRYLTDNNPHLAEIAQQHEAVFSHWQQSVELSDSEKVIPKNDSGISVEERIVQDLKRALEQQHLGGEQQPILYPHIASCLGNAEKQKVGEIQILTESTLWIKGKLSAEEMDLRKRMLLQKQLVDLFSSPQNLEKKLIVLKSLVPIDTEFYRDVESSLKMLKTPLVEKSTSYQVIDTDDPNHILLMGTEVLNSCQAVTGNPDLNVCLLGYFLDGKHRLGLVCDSQGKILARTVLRLLIDDMGQPVLMMERMYAADASPAYAPLLKKLAIKKAASLGVPLLVSPKDYPDALDLEYPLSIHAKGKPVPFEYVDALNGKQPYEYVIEQTIQLYNPFKGE